MKDLPEGYTPLDSIPLPQSNRFKSEMTGYRILSEVNQPIVWRFMNKEFVDRFFSTGEIRLSTYTNYAKLDNPIRQDTEEGKVVLQSTEKNLRCEMKVGVGFNAFVLCTSLSQNNKLSEGEAYDACIEINDILSFIRIVTLKLIEQVHVIGVVHGACIYHNREFHNEIGDNNISKILEQTSKGNSLDFTLFTRIAEETGGKKVFFSKPIEKQEECEYRMVWLTDQEQSEPITISVPEARAYCRPIYFE